MVTLFLLSKHSQIAVKSQYWVRIWVSLSESLMAEQFKLKIYLKLIRLVLTFREKSWNHTFIIFISGSQRGIHVVFTCFYAYMNTPNVQCSLFLLFIYFTGCQGKTISLKKGYKPNSHPSVSCTCKLLRPCFPYCKAWEVVTFT